MATVSFDREAVVGRVDVALTVTNTIDQARAEAGDIDANAVRSVTLDGVLVDTGATFLSLPADVIARLGLRSDREVLGLEPDLAHQRLRLLPDDSPDSYVTAL